MGPGKQIFVNIISLFPLARILFTFNKSSNSGFRVVFSMQISRIFHKLWVKMFIIFQEGMPKRKKTNKLGVMTTPVPKK